MTKYSHEAFKTIILAGLFVGSLDILAAFADVFIETGKGPEGVLRYIASGVFGKNAFSGSSIMILMGLAFHFIIAFALTIFFFIVYPKIKPLQTSILLTATIFAIVSWAITNLLIVPLSNTPDKPFRFADALKASLILFFTIGVPLAIIFRNFFKCREKDENIDMGNYSK